MFTELFMNKSTHNQFRTRTVIRVTRVFYIGESGFARVISLALANTNIQYKQINYDADKIYIDK